jgi:hypothetical protein
MTASSAPAGGYLVGESQPMPVIDMLRPWSPVLQAGVQVLEGLTGTVRLPAIARDPETGLEGAPAVFLHEGDDTVPAQPVLGTVALTMKTASIVINMSRQIITQADSIETTLRALLLRRAAMVLGQQLLAGTGVGGQALGLLNSSALGSGDGTNATVQDVGTMIGICLSDGADESRLTFVGGLETRSLFGRRTELGSGSRALWSDGRVAGIPAVATALCTADALVLGDWSRCFVGLWGQGITLAVNPFEGFDRGTVALRLMLDFDVCLPAPGSAGFAAMKGIT